MEKHLKLLKYYYKVSRFPIPKFSVYHCITDLTFYSTPKRRVFRKYGSAIAGFVRSVGELKYWIVTTHRFKQNVIRPITIFK